MEEILQCSLQIPLMKKFEEQMFTLQRLEAALKRSISYPPDSCGEV
jgi:hypothetical protein